MPEMTLRQELRMARSSARHLRNRIETQTLDVTDAHRLVGKVVAFLDHLEEIATEEDAAARPAPAIGPRGVRSTLTVLDGGRA